MAERQDWRIVKAILEYRNADYAMELFRSDRKRLAESPASMTMLLRLGRAQFGSDYGETALQADLRDEDDREDGATVPTSIGEPERAEVA